MPRRTNKATQRSEAKRKTKKIKGIEKRLALWENASPSSGPQYPRGTPFFDPHIPDFPIMRDPKSASSILNTIPCYRTQPLHKITIVPRETPSRPHKNFSVALNPLHCTYKISHKKGKSHCTITHIPTNVSLTCTARCDTTAIRCIAEYRLSKLIKVHNLETGLKTVFGAWVDQLDEEICERRRKAISDRW
tara:strand:+ start:1085 stop:1657 length:573 start_codon:yes stop_codon:yes gene_type:complete